MTVKPTLNSADIELLKGTFTTKDDLKDLATKKDVQKLDKKLDDLFNFLDKDLSKTKRRVSFIDRHLKIDTSTL